MYKFIAWGFAGVCLVIVILTAVDFGPKKSKEQMLTDNQIAARSEKEFHAALVGAQQLKARLRDPESMKLSSVLVMQDGSVCYAYRARNGFGGYDSDQALAMGPFVMTDTKDKDFHKLWSAECAGKRGSNLTDDVTTGLGLSEQASAK